MLRFLDLVLVKSNLLLLKIWIDVFYGATSIIIDLGLRQFVQSGVLCSLWHLYFRGRKVTEMSRFGHGIKPYFAFF